VNFKVDLPEAHLAELKTEAEFYALENVMFPLVPELPMKLKDMDKNQFTVTQDEKGLWYATDDLRFQKYLISVCDECKQGCVVCSNGFMSRFIQFTATRKMFPEQPTLTVCCGCSPGLPRSSSR